MIHCCFFLCFCCLFQVGVLRDYFIVLFCAFLLQSMNSSLWLLKVRHMKELKFCSPASLGGCGGPEMVTITILLIVIAIILLLPMSWSWCSCLLPQISWELPSCEHTHWDLILYPCLYLACSLALDCVCLPCLCWEVVHPVESLITLKSMIQYFCNLTPCLWFICTIHFYLFTSSC